MFKGIIINKFSTFLSIILIITVLIFLSSCEIYKKERDVQKSIDTVTTAGDASAADNITTEKSKKIPHEKTNSGTAAIAEDTEEPKPAGSPDFDLASKPMAIMVENSQGARPQSGLIHADVVYETIVEAGITRFVAIFSTNEPTIVGPLRSARPYFAEIALSFNPIYVFFGTHPQYYEYIENLGMNVLSAKPDYTGNSSIKAQAPYWRDWSRSDVLWHTACVSVPALKQKAEQLGYPMEGESIPFLYKSDPALEARGNISNISISFSTHAFSPDGFDVKYSYNRFDNSYYRYMAGVPHIDFTNEKQITAKNIVIMISDIEGPIDQYGHMSVRTTGSGDAIFFQDGHAFMGSWERNGIEVPYGYLDSRGDQVDFTTGPIWVAIVQSFENISY